MKNVKRKSISKKKSEKGFVDPKSAEMKSAFQESNTIVLVKKESVEKESCDKITTNGLNIALTEMKQFSDDIFKIATVNVNSISCAFKKGFVQYVASDNPDIICIQETKLHEKSPKGCDSYTIDGYEAYFCNCEDKKGYAGTAIYTKIQPIAVHRACNDPHGRIMLMEFDKFYLVNVYAPNIGMEFEKKDYLTNVWCPTIINFLKTLCKSKLVILCGDCNSGTSHLDLFDDKVYKNIMRRVKGAINWLTLLIDEGFTDVFRYLYPDKQQFTYFGAGFKMKEKGKGYRLDYFFMPTDVVSAENSMILDVKILNADFSDHVPSVLFLKKDEILSENDKPINQTKAVVIPYTMHVKLVLI